MPKLYLDDAQLDSEVAWVLGMHKGKDNAIPRWRLVAQIFGEDAATEDMQNDDNPYDRQVRDSIERFRAKGMHYCNLGGGRGYFIASNREEYEEFKKYYGGAALRKLQIMSVMDESADERWGRVPRKTSHLQPSLLP
jgi:hypothetical protein